MTSSVSKNATAFTLLMSLFVVAAADNDLSGFAGTWKEDLSKTVARAQPSDVITYSQNADGSMTQTVGVGPDKREQSFRIDGQVHPRTDVPEISVSWTALGPSSWERKTMRNGNITFRNVRTISADGKTMTLTAHAFEKNLTSIETKVYTRTSGESSGLVGSWKAVSVKSETPDVMEIQVLADGTITFHELVPDFHFSAKLDGKDYAVTGTNANPKLRASFRRVADRTIEQTAKNGDKPFELITWTLSRDGQSIAQTTRLIDPDGPVNTSLYRRQ
jgi:hypothetical protein